MEDGEFKVLDPVDVGDLSEVSERQLIPASRKVKVQIKRVSPRQNTEGTWKWLSVAMQLVDGIQEGDKIRYKGAYVQTENIAYYADPVKYADVVSDKQYLGRLASLERAVGMPNHRVDDELIAGLKDKIIIVDIIQKQDKFLGEKVNIAQNFKALPPEMSV